ncbi:MAG: DUF5678 domain-containing protein [Chloroflexota bacterium]
METIELRPDLREMLEKDAVRESKSVNEAVNEAVRRYLHERQREKIGREVKAFIAMHAELKEKYFGLWVAVHDGKLIDHDSDCGALYKRVRARYGKTSVLIREVEEEPDRDLWFRTPSTGRIAP